MKRDSKGFSAVEGLLILIILGILAGVGWYVWKSNNQANKSLNNADKSNSIKTNTSVNSTKCSKEPELTAECAKLIPSVDNSLAIKEWDVKIPVNKDTQGLSYSIDKNGVVSFRTTELNKLSGSCTSNSVQVVRGKASDKVPNEIGSQNGESFLEKYNEVMKTKDQTVRSIAVKAGDYYYVYPDWSGASCVTQSSQSGQEAAILLSIVKAVNQLTTN
jgi:hypothetical protein